jgi:hypothetical protein
VAIAVNTNQTLSAAWMNRLANATAYTLVWCLLTSITTWRRSAENGMRLRKPQYESTEKIAMTVNTIAAE